MKSKTGYKKTFSFKIENDFGVDFRCNMWYDEMENKDFSSIINYANEKIISKKLHLLDVNGHEHSHWNKKNLFVEMKDDNTMKNIMKSIKKSYKQFVKSINGEEKDVYINGWLNIMTNKEVNKLKGHLHANHENAYLSGNLVLTETKNSKTSFALIDWNNPTRYHLHTVENKKGNFNIFPSWLYHWVGPVEEELRIVLGFDLILKKSIDYYWKHNSDIDYPIKRAIKL